MKSTSEEIFKIAKDFLEKNSIEYISIDKPTFFNANYTGNDLKTNHWSIPYNYKVFETESAFIKIEDDTKNIIYIIHKHGYSYPNGVKETVEYEDDGEDWNEDI
jgi:hypothetical protein